MIALRPWRLDDAPALAAAWADPEVARWTAVPLDRSVEAAAGWIEGWDERRRRGLALDLVVVRAGHEATVLGEVGASFVARPPAIGWWVFAAVRGQGVASRAVQLFVNDVLPLTSATEAVATTHEGNPASAAVARRAGLTEVAPGRFAWIRPGRPG